MDDGQPISELYEDCTDHQSTITLKVNVCNELPGERSQGSNFGQQNLDVYASSFALLTEESIQGQNRIPCLTIRITQLAEVKTRSVT